MSPLQVHSLIQASAPLHLKAKLRTSSLPTAGLGKSSTAPQLFGENGVIWGLQSNNTMYPAAFSSITAFENLGVKFSSAWASPLNPLDAGAYATTAFSYLDVPGLRSDKGYGDEAAWMYAVRPSLAPMSTNFLTMLGACPTSKAGPCKGIAATSNVLTASGPQTMAVAYVVLLQDTSNPGNSIWGNGRS